MKKTVDVIVIVVCVVLMCPMMFTFAATNKLMDYNGKEICSKRSIDYFTLGKKTDFVIHHNTTSWSGVPGRNTDDLFVKISVQKKGWLSYSDTGNSFKLYSTGAKKAKFTEESGIYKLYFTANQFAANINGVVKMK